MSTPSAVVYYSQRCPNCNRFMDGLRRSTARTGVQIVNVDDTPIRGVQYVPTVVLPAGQVLVGTKAFEWLKEHETDGDLEPYSLAMSRGLAFSSIQGTGHAEFQESFSPFVRPE
jgi:hypothetical protein